MHFEPDIPLITNEQAYSQFKENNTCKRYEISFSSRFKIIIAFPHENSANRSTGVVYNIKRNVNSFYINGKIIHEIEGEGVFEVILKNILSRNKTSILTAA
jgi:hypothetical protein